MSSEHIEWIEQSEGIDFEEGECIMKQIYIEDARLKMGYGIG